MKAKKSFSWVNNKIEVRKIDKYGKGVFANGNIKKGEMICIFGGYIMSAKEEQELPNFRDEAFQIYDNFVLGIKRNSELETASYFNHSCDPNTGFKGQIFLVAMRNIKPEEEITFDYAMVLNQPKDIKTYRMACRCGKINCRKVITANDWKKKDLQTRYEGFFQWYLQEKINNLQKQS